MQRRLAQKLTEEEGPVSNKTCPDCKLELPIENFPFKGHEPNRPPRRGSRCPDCKRIYSRHGQRRRAAAKRALLPHKHVPPSGFKTCIDCKIDKNKRNFNKQKSNKDGFAARCRKCVARKRALKREPLKSKRNYLSGIKRCKGCSTNKSWTDFRIVKKKENKTLYYLCIDCERKYDRNRCGRSGEIVNNKPYRPRRTTFSIEDGYNNPFFKGKTKNRRKNDPLSKSKTMLRLRMRSCMKKIRRRRKDPNYLSFLGCSEEQFRSYIQLHWQPGMTWHNYGRGRNKWVLDHTIPLYSAKCEADVYSLFNFTNIRPMWDSYNALKKHRLPNDWAACKLARGIDESIPPGAALRTLKPTAIPG